MALRSTLIIAPVVALIAAVLVFISGDVASALTLQEGVEAARGTGQPVDLFGAGGVITMVTNTLLFIAGALAVIMVIYGGIRYAISGGNSAAVTAAKNTVLYAIVGLIIAFIAFAAVNFVLGALIPTGAESGGAGFTNV